MIRNIPKVPLTLGAQVKLGKLKGCVVRPGPYGDQEFQIKDERGDYHSFINNDGTCPYTKDVWKVIKKKHT